MEYKRKYAPEFDPMFGWPETVLRFKSYRQIRTEENFTVGEITYSFFPVDDLSEVRCYELETPCLGEEDMTFLGALLRHETTLKKNFALSYNPEYIRIINFNKDYDAEALLKEIQDVAKDFKPVTSIALCGVKYSPQPDNPVTEISDRKFEELKEANRERNGQYYKRGELYHPVVHIAPIRRISK